MAASPRASPGCRCPASTSRRRSTRSRATTASLLEHYRRFLAFRRAHPAFAKGDIEFLAAEGDTLAFTRREGNEQIVCAFNLGAQAGDARSRLGAKLAAARRPRLSRRARDDGKIRLGGYGAWFGRMA